MVNHKRVLRLYRAEGLTMRRRKRKRVAYDRVPALLAAAGPNRRWALDFVSDALAWGRRIRLLAIVDVFTRECLAIEVDTSLPAQRVSHVLNRIVTERGVPQEIQLDNGPELTSRVLDQWAYERGVQLRLSSQASPCRTPSSRASTAGCAMNA
jgi:putative transposase